MKFLDLIFERKLPSLLSREDKLERTAFTVTVAIVTAMRAREIDLDNFDGVYAIFSTYRPPENVAELVNQPSMPAAHRIISILSDAAIRACDEYKRMRGLR